LLLLLVFTAFIGTIIFLKQKFFFCYYKPIFQKIFTVTVIGFTVTVNAGAYKVLYWITKIIDLITKFFFWKQTILFLKSQLCFWRLAKFSFFFNFAIVGHRWTCFSRLIKEHISLFTCAFSSGQKNRSFRFLNMFRLSKIVSKESFC